MQVKDSILDAVNRALGTIHKFKEGVTVRRNPLDRVKVASVSEFLECRINFEMFKIEALKELPYIYDGYMWLLDYIDGEDFRSFTECRYALNLDNYNPDDLEKNSLLEDLLSDLDGDGIFIYNAVRPPMVSMNYRC